MNGCYVRVVNANTSHSPVCVHRLVVIADKDKVHSQFPIPLINRLEKHYVSATSFLMPHQKSIKRDLEKWAAQFVEPGLFYRFVCFIMLCSAEMINGARQGYY